MTVLFLISVLSSCQVWDFIWKWEIVKENKTDQKYTTEICNWIWMEKWTYSYVNDNINTKTKIKKVLIDCYQKETDETSSIQLEISDFKYYENWRRLCDHNWYTTASTIKRILDDNWDVIWQRVSCYNKWQDLDSTKWFTVDFSNQDLKN